MIAQWPVRLFQNRCLFPVEATCFGNLFCTVWTPVSLTLYIRFGASLNFVIMSDFIKLAHLNSIKAHWSGDADFSSERHWKLVLFYRFSREITPWMLFSSRKRIRYIILLSTWKHRNLQDFNEKPQNLLSNSLQWLTISSYWAGVSPVWLESYA